MSGEIEFRFIGWCNKTDRDGSKHDKVWTAFKVGNTHYAGWGARGKKLQFKNYGTGLYARDEQGKVMRSKQGKYQEVDSFQLFCIFPTFKEDVSQMLMMAVLTNKVK
jgi:hypothetical protein